MRSPWQPTEELLSISSGIVAPSDTLADIDSAKATGEEQVQEYITNRLVQGNVDVFSPIKTTKLRSFAPLGKSDRSKETSTIL